VTAYPCRLILVRSSVAFATEDTVIAWMTWWPSGARPLSSGGDIGKDKRVADIDAVDTFELRIGTHGGSMPIERLPIHRRSHAAQRVAWTHGECL
jgi:hypothetical protein